MWYTKRYDDNQIKANRAASARACGAQDDAILRHPELRKKTWSSELPAYYGTELGAGSKRGSSMGPVAFSKHCSNCDREYRCVWPDEEVCEDWAPDTESSSDYQAWLAEGDNGTEEH